MAIKSWLTNCFLRIYPQTPAGRNTILKLDSALNEKSAFQLVLRNDGTGNPIDVNVSVKCDGNFDVRIRRVGYVMASHFNTPIEGTQNCEGLDYLPGLVPDPLFDCNSIQLPSKETHAFWINIYPKKNIKHGKYKIVVTCNPENQVPREHNVEVLIHDIKIKPRRDFHVTHWFYTDAIMDWYKTDGYDKRFWKLLPAYLKNMVEHGQDTVLVPLFTPPLDGVKTPCQLLKVRKNGKGKYNFDFSDVKKYIQFAKECGIEYFEWCHLVTQWGAEYAIRVYEEQGKTGKLLWSPHTRAMSRTYQDFLRQLLPRLNDFLKKQNIIDKSFFHLSDEPHGQTHRTNYMEFRTFLKNFAPWMKIMDAISDIEFAKDSVIDVPVANENVLMDFKKMDISCWVYYCCTPRGKYLNHLIDTPLAKIAMHGLLCYRFNLRGFLHWGYNYWYRRHTRDLVSPFLESDAGSWPEWPYGDPFLVYPGSEGPIDSIRWEVIGLGFQDYALLETIGLSRKDKRLSQIKNFESFPKNSAWRLNLRKQLLIG